MKKIIFITLFFIVPVLSLTAQNQENLIKLKNFVTIPSGISQPGEGIENIADGNANTLFHTLWRGIQKQNITIEAELEGKGKKLDQIIIYPRNNGRNGIIKSAEVWVKSKNGYQKISTIESEVSNSPIIIEPEKSILSPEKIKIIVSDAYPELFTGKYMVSLAEVKCIMLPKNAATKADKLKEAAMFENNGTTLKQGISKKQIQKMKVPALQNLALEILNKTYNSENRLATYEAYKNPSILGKELYIGDGFSKYEGITGIWLDKGENVVFVGKTNGEKLTLLVPEWGRKPPAGIQPERDPAGWGLASSSFELKEGVNFINLKKAGNVYVQYFTDENPATKSPISIHFPTGKVNGYFDINRGDTNADFDKLLENAVSPILDMRGKYIQVAFPVDSLKKFTKGKGVELVKNFDKILELERHLIGWEKEGISPKNHILARINHHYYMFRDGDGVAYIDWAMRLVAKPESVIKGDPCWGFSHEAGHVLQPRQLTWGGMTEVSNNILTMYATTSLGNKSRLLAENTYEKARNIILDKKISYMDFPGKANAGESQYGGSSNTDVFQRLVPFWQLNLYFASQGNPDFYPDLMIALRKQAPYSFEDRNKGYLDMLRFCKTACEVSKTDLTEFFDRWGFFYVGEIDVNDYAPYVYQVSEAEVNAVKKEIADMKLPKPKVDITTLQDEK